MRYIFSMLLFLSVSYFNFLHTVDAAEESAQSNMVYELRTYTTHSGRLDALHKRFRDHTMGLFKKHGMTNVIYWTPTDKPNTLVYLLAHQSEEAGRKSFAAFRADPEWLKVRGESEKDAPIVEKVESLYLKPTDFTPPGSFAEQVRGKSGLTYELRIYTTNPGKLPNLNARFRDHTMKLFEKHGMSNVLYTTPLDEKMKDNTLVYVIAHENPEAAEASWAAFQADPQWKRVAEESQRDGKILAQDGVKRLFLNTTDYSPIR